MSKETERARRMSTVDGKTDAPAPVEDSLRLDPADAYDGMDAASKETYRGIVAEAAAACGVDERVVAEACLSLARDGARALGASAPEAHVGRYLAPGGLGALRRAVGGGGGVALRLRGASMRRRLALYSGTLLLPAVAFTAGTAFFARAGGVRGGFFILSVLLFAAAGAHAATALADCLVTKLLPPRRMPRMNFAAGIPADHRTLAVTPAVLGGDGGNGEAAVGRALRNLENQYLNNRGANIHFALLTAFAGGEEENAERPPEDGRLLNLVRLGIHRLNEKHAGNGGDNFLLFHRSRAGGDGALADLARYLGGGDADAFSRIEGAAHRLSGVRYILAPGADALLPRGAAAAMAAAMAHPLNRAKYDARRGRVVAGHGVLRPRAAATLPPARRTLFTRLFAGEAGLDGDAAERARVRADARQELFGESAFDGTGIFDVRALLQALDSPLPGCDVPANALLAGGILRAGFLGDVAVYRDPPESVSAAADCRFRAVRGDWRVFRRGAPAAARRRLGVAGQWRIIDALRRAFSPVAAFCLVALATAARGNVEPYFLAAVCILLADQLAAGPAGLARRAGQVLLRFACLPFEALVNLSGIAAGLRRRGSGTAPGRMWACPAAAAAIAAVMPYSAGALPARHGFAKAAVLLLWLSAPAAAAWLSRRRAPRAEASIAGNEEFLRRAARRFWLFFEDRVGDGENWLPPEAAQRTTPAAMGLSLLANLAALDFGYAAPGEMLRRCERTLDAMSGLERRRGHFLARYDTRTRQPVKPLLVPAADSGQLAAHLLVLAEGLREMAAAPVVPQALWAGLRDTAQLALEEAKDGEAGPARGLREMESALARLRASPPATPAACHARLAALEKKAAALEAAWNADPENDGARRWLSLFTAQCRSALGELHALVPWAAETAEHPEWGRFAWPAAIPSLLDIVNMAPRAAELAAVPEHVAGLLRQAGERASRRLAAVQRLLSLCDRLADIDFSLLYDAERKRLFTGYNTAARTPVHGRHDRIDSGARLAVYLGIAQNKLPQESWFAMERPDASAGPPTADSLLPFLVMPSYEGAAPRPARGGGILSLIGCADDRGFMAKHQGMSLVALAQALLGRPMHRRFLASPVLGSAVLLLQETAPAVRPRPSPPPSPETAQAYSRLDPVAGNGYPSFF